MASRIESRCLAAFAFCLQLGAAAPASADELPPERRCPGDGLTSDAASGDEAIDATRSALRTGSVVEHADLAALRALLPNEIWQHRDAFFFAGMRLTVGACHRRYSPSDAFAEASRVHAGQARLDASGNLFDDAAGLPFDPAAIDPRAPDAGIRWAWDLERRYRGAGPVGSFRIVDLPDDRLLESRTSPRVFSGKFFLADLAMQPTRAGRHARNPNSWVAGGDFRTPPDARGLAWRQYRSRKAARDADRPDDVFVYLPGLRKMRRAAGAHSDGMFVPRYRAAGEDNARVIPYGQGGRLGTIEAGHASALAAAEDIERGFTGLALRPNAWTWRVVAAREVLALLNARTEGWPLRDDRNYGPSGLSLASDTWDVRWAIVIEGRARDTSVPSPRVTYWVDAQTAQPLYAMRRSATGALREVGVLAHRYSVDAPRYPALPDGSAARVFDPVAAAFLTLPSGGWRRESWDSRSLPLGEGELRAALSTDALIRGR